MEMRKNIHLVENIGTGIDDKHMEKICNHRQLDADISIISNHGQSELSSRSKRTENISQSGMKLIAVHLFTGLEIKCSTIKIYHIKKASHPWCM